MAEKETFFPMEKIVGQIIHDQEGQRFEIKSIHYESEYIEILLLEVNNKIKMSYAYFERWINQVLA
jgi:hypothetical protein